MQLIHILAASLLVEPIDVLCDHRLQFPLLLPLGQLLVGDVGFKAKGQHLLPIEFEEIGRIPLIKAVADNHLRGITPEIILSMVVWVVIMMLLISPLIYFAVVPKPVRKHIKNIDELNSYERKTREEELESNASLDKIMKKYKNTGKK